MVCVGLSASIHTNILAYNAGICFYVQCLWERHKPIPPCDLLQRQIFRIDLNVILVDRLDSLLFLKHSELHLLACAFERLN